MAKRKPHLASNQTPKTILKTLNKTENFTIHSRSTWNSKIVVAAAAASRQVQNVFYLISNEVQISGKFSFSHKHFEVEWAL